MYDTVQALFQKGGLYGKRVTRARNLSTFCMEGVDELKGLLQYPLATDPGSVRCQLFRPREPSKD